MVLVYCRMVERRYPSLNMILVVYGLPRENGTKTASFLVIAPYHTPHDLMCSCDSCVASSLNREKPRILRCTKEVIYYTLLDPSHLKPTHLALTYCAVL